MPVLERPDQPTLYYAYDDYTDPWRDAPVMLLQHGYSRSSKFWYQWIPYLSRYYRIVRMDLRGLGRSSTDFDRQSGLSVEAMIGDLLAVIDEVGGGPVHYCGESLGGILGMVLAAEHPDKLRTLSVVGAPLGISEKTQRDFSCGYGSWQEALRELGAEKWSENINGAVRFPPGTDPEMMRWYASETGKSDVESLIRLAEIASSVDLRPYLPRITTPTLGIYPTTGTITGGDDRVMAEQMKHFRLVRVPTHFHAIQFLMPAACANEVRHFASQFDGVVFHE